MTSSTAIAVGWITLAFINAGLAQSKGRSGWTWWLVSLLIGPLATALVVVWSPVRPPTSVDAPNPPR